MAEEPEGPKRGRGRPKGKSSAVAAVRERGFAIWASLAPPPSDAEVADFLNKEFGTQVATFKSVEKWRVAHKWAERAAQSVADARETANRQGTLAVAHQGPLRAKGQDPLDILEDAACTLATASRQAFEKVLEAIPKIEIKTAEELDIFMRAVSTLSRIQAETVKGLCDLRLRKIEAFDVNGAPRPAEIIPPTTEGNSDRTELDAVIDNFQKERAES